MRAALVKAALCARGVLAAKSETIITLDGDGQNIPADIPKMLEAIAGAPPTLAMVAGERATRKDRWAKRAASRLANGLRRWALNDKAKDVGCGLKLFRRAAFLELPYFDHMHRYLIALMQREGYEGALRCRRPQAEKCGPFEIW